MQQFVNDPNIVTVKEVFKENNTAYIVMEFIEGETFLEYLRGRDKLSPAEALRLLEPMVGALERVHKAGLTHRDFTPSNIMFTRDGSVKLLDFGSARETSVTDPTGMLKRGYSPPEQYMSNTKDESGKQGSWTDVYAFAATIYYALTKQVPPDGLKRRALDTLIPPSKKNKSVTPEQEKVLLDGMALDWTKRYQTVRELYDALKATLKSKSQSSEHLEIGCRLTGDDHADQYVISGVLGQGEYSITYLAWDERGDQPVAIKEFFPRMLARRDSDHRTVFTLTPEEEAAHPSWYDDAAIPSEGAAQIFRKTMAHFLERAQQMSAFNREANAVGVKKTFRSNGTAYVVMEYIEGGETLEQRLQSRGRMNLSEALNLIAPIANVLERMHSAFFFHQDVRPNNIMFTRDGTLKLMDSGAPMSREIDEFVIRYQTIELKMRYNPPPEPDGAEADVYSLAAIVYRLITGVVPPTAFKRTAHNDPLKPPSSFGVEITARQEAALLKAIRIPHVRSVSPILNRRLKC